MKPTLGWRGLAFVALMAFAAKAAIAQVLFGNGFETPPVVINEIDSNPGDWIEFHNPTSVPFDVSGWMFTDSDPSHVYTFAAGTIIPAGGFLVLIGPTEFTFGLGAPDEVRLFDASGTPVDTFGWAAHAAGTFARCPDGTGPFVDVATPTQGTSNAPACP